MALTPTNLSTLEWHKIETCAIEFGREVALVATIWPWQPSSLSPQQAVSWFIDYREGEKTQRLEFGSSMTRYSARLAVEAALHRHAVGMNRRIPLIKSLDS